MGREVRRVPADWEHPKDDHGRYAPLFGGSFSSAAKDWDEGKARWDAGERESWAKDQGAEVSFEEWDGPRPNADHYMPDWPAEERTHLMMYEATSEGTPISPAFETPEKLACWLVDNNASAVAGQPASYEAWLRVARGGFAPSAVVRAGAMTSGVEGLADDE